MVDQSYMLAKQPPPSAAKRFFDQRVMPVTIDLAGTLEAGLEHVAVTARAKPAVVLGAALVLGAAMAMLLRRMLAPPPRRFRG